MSSMRQVYLLISILLIIKLFIHVFDFYITSLVKSDRSLEIT